MNGKSAIVPVPPPPAAGWQEELRGALRRAHELCAAVGVDPALGADSDFPVLAPWPLLRRIRPGDPADPILRQLLSSPEESLEVPGYGPDPLAEAAASPAPALIHKYHGRALLIATGACALHCRYCFRREFPYGAHARGRLQQALQALREAPDIGEIILSGGDPLSLDDTRLAVLLTELEAIPHLHTLRLHTRFPIAIPQRVTPALLARLRASRLQVVSVVHVNHAQELDAHTATALRGLATLGPLLNQAVLLAGINDSVEALEALSRALFAQGVLPYYLHQLDRVRGAAHFAVDDARARALCAQLQARLPGYLLPRLAREEAGRAHKTLL